jgi:hypothetical protein
MAATAKSLLAIILHLKIISLQWFYFVEEPKAAVPFPKEER